MNVEIDTSKIFRTTTTATKQSLYDQTTVTTEVSDSTKGPSSGSMKKSTTESRRARRRSSIGSSSVSTKTDLDDSKIKRHTKKRTKRKESWDVLMGLIANEMASSWAEDGDHLAQTAITNDAVPPTYTAAELFYAQMNGEQLDNSTPRHDSVCKRIKNDDITRMGQTEEDMAGQDLSDHTSCSGLDIEEKLMEEDEEGAAVVPEDLSISHRSKLSRSTSGSSADSSLDTLSIREIKDMVLPAGVRKNIPEEAWGRIFEGPTVDKTRKSVIKLTVEDELEEEEKDDDSSVISDITMHTNSSNRRRHKVATRDLTEEEEARNAFYEHMKRSCVQRSKTSGVRFGNVQVRYYQRILDVNPGVTSGVAIGIGWRYKRGGVISVDEWENQKGIYRSSNELVLPKLVREAMLKDLGYTQKDFATATRIILKAKRNRQVTVQNLGCQQFEESVEKASRRVMGLLSFGKKRGLV